MVVSEGYVLWGTCKKVGDEEGDDGVGSKLKLSRGRSRVKDEVDSEAESS